MITSASNEKVKRIKKLMKSASYRKKEQKFLVEGIRMVREIPKEWLVSLYVTESGQQKFEEELRAFSSVQVEIVKDSVFAGMADTNTPQGILAEVKMPGYNISDLLMSHSSNAAMTDSMISEEEIPFILVIEHLQDPGNLGTIMRTAEGAGVTGILMSDDTVDMYNPKVIRSTMGSVFRVPFCVTDHLEEDIHFLKNNGVMVYGAHLSGGDFYEKNFSTPCAFLIGNEGHGLSEAISKTADDLIRIPMKGKVESLNAAISTAVIAYEVLRQRSR